MISQNKLADNIMKETKIHDLIPDDKNFNQGTEYGAHLIEESLLSTRIS